MSDVEETARDFLARIRTNDDSGHGVCMDDVDVADLAEKFAAALDTPKPDTSPVCVETLLAEARAQGAAEERERLAKDADARKIEWREDGKPGREGVWCSFAQWLRSNTGEG